MNCRIISSPRIFGIASRRGRPGTPLCLCVSVAPRPFRPTCRVARILWSPTLRTNSVRAEAPARYHGAMRRPLLRGSLHLLTLVCLLLALSTVILWARSAFVSDELSWARFHCDGLDYRRRSVVLLPGQGVLVCNFFFATDVFRPGTQLSEQFFNDDPNGVRWTTRPGPATPFVEGLMLNPWTAPRP